MAIAWVGSQVAATGSTTLSPAAEGSAVAGDYLLIFVGTKGGAGAAPPTPDTPTGYTLLGTFAGTTGTSAADTGPTRITAFGKVATGADPITTISVPSGNTGWARKVTLSDATGLWDVVASVGGQDTTGGTAWSAVMGSDPGITAGDLVFASSCIPTDVGGTAMFSAEAMTATGVTFGTMVEQTEMPSSGGLDIAGVLFRQPVSAGTATSAVTVSMTATGTTTNVYGPTILVRLRETAGGAPNQGSATGTTTFTGTSAGARTPKGSTVGTSTFTGTASGQRISLGSASGTSTFTGVASGARVSTGSGTGTVTFTGTAAGTRTPKGASTGVTTWTGTATGSAPAIGGASGSASGSTLWTGTAVGTARGVGGSSGSASGSIMWTGTATGATVQSGSCAGLATWTGTAAGVRASAGSAVGSTVWTGIAGGMTPAPSRDLTLTVTGPVGYATAVTGPVGRIFATTGPTGSALSITGPAGRTLATTGPTGHPLTVRSAP